MSHEKRMHMIDEQGAGGFALEEGHKLDSSAVEKIQETVDVSEIVAKYDKESVYRSFKGWLDIFIKILCIAFSAFHLYTAATTPFAPPIQRCAIMWNVTQRQRTVAAQIHVPDLNIRLQIT